MSSLHFEKDVRATTQDVGQPEQLLCQLESFPVRDLSLQVKDRPDVNKTSGDHESNDAVKHADYRCNGLANGAHSANLSGKSPILLALRDLVFDPVVNFIFGFVSAVIVTTLIWTDALTALGAHQ